MAAWQGTQSVFSAQHGVLPSMRVIAGTRTFESREIRAARQHRCFFAVPARRNRVVLHGTLPSGRGAQDSYAAAHDNAFPAPREPSPGAGSSSSSAWSPADQTKFVSLFRQASPYIEGHRGKTFVLSIPGTVSEDHALLQRVLSDIALLHGLGVKLVVVAGVQSLIDKTLRERGMSPRYMSGYRITDPATLKVTIEVAGEVRTFCEQALSKGPAVPMIRRHTKAENSEIHFEPALHVVSGNYVTAKRRGIIDGIDYGLTGEVRFVLKDAIKRQLEDGNIVLLSHLGFTAGGEVLNCNAPDIALHAAVELGADKLFFFHLDDEVADLDLPAWLPLTDAQDMLIRRVEGLITGDQMDQLLASMDMVELTADPPSSPNGHPTHPNLSNYPGHPSPSSPSSHPAAPASDPGQPSESPNSGRGRAMPASLLTMPRSELLLNLDIWAQSGFPAAVSACVIACCKGVKRSHLLDARVDGGLLLELYSRDGVGTMISANFFEGIRHAHPSDVDGVQGLLKPLERDGVLVQRSRNELEGCINNFVVIEREGKLMGCAMLLPLGNTEDGISVAELGAFTVDPAFRGSGRGDSMLDFVEQEARNQGMRRLVLLTTRTADWFEQRDFKFSGPAAESRLLPEARRKRVNPARNSQLYVKELEVAGAAMPRPGKRIGF